MSSDALLGGRPGIGLMRQFMSVNLPDSTGYFEADHSVDLFTMMNSEESYEYEGFFRDLYGRLRRGRVTALLRHLDPKTNRLQIRGSGPVTWVDG